MKNNQSGQGILQEAPPSAGQNRNKRKSPVRSTTFPRGGYRKPVTHTTHLYAAQPEGKGDIGTLRIYIITQEGFLALYDAVEGYDSGRGCQFITYAGYLIKRRLSRYAQAAGNTASMPDYAVKELIGYKEFFNAFLLCAGRAPTREEAAKRMGVPVSHVRKLERFAAMERAESLEAPAAGSSHNRELGELLPAADNLEIDVLERLQREQLARILWVQVDRLPAEQGFVLRQRYCSRRTYREIGACTGVGEAKVRSVEQKALRRLRLSRASMLLRSFLPEYNNIYSRGIRGNGAGRFSTTWTSSTERVALEDMAKKSVTSNVTSRI